MKLKTAKKQITYKLKRHKPRMVREVTSATITAYQTEINNNLKDTKKDYGIVFTPERIVDLMVNLIDHSLFGNKKNINILEPACGLAQFLIGIKRNLPDLFNSANLCGVEINDEIVKYLTTLEVGNNIKLIKTDYLIWHQDMFFDLIIGNPPYGIPSLSEHYAIKVDAATKEQYRNAFETWYGKYNVYGAFIEKSIKMLKPNGQLIFIIPPTFMILDDFKKLRTFLSKHGMTKIIYLGPDVFKPDADVTSVILEFHKSDAHAGNLKLLEYNAGKIIAVKVAQNWQGEVVKFETEYTKQLEGVCSHLLSDIYDISVSPRTTEIKHNPNITTIASSNGHNYLPILNGRNLKCHRIIYDNLTGYWIKKSDAKKLRGYFETPHIVIGLGFREDGRVAAACDQKCYPWMGDVYHLLKKDNLFGGGFDLTEEEILGYLNSDYLKRYVKETYREITYHLSITQIKNFPLPSKKEWQEIKRKDFGKWLLES
ncbi:MAG: TaqI-like C-terminal specificity domain-containing protein [Planctomycetota bacterium]